MIDDWLRQDVMYLRARRQARAKILWYLHAGVYVVVNLLLFAIDALTEERWWFYWPLLTWGAGLALHLLVTLVLGGYVGDLERRSVERDLDRPSRRRGR